MGISEIMCCGGRMCMLSTCAILVVILIGLIVGFGIFTDSFHNIKGTLSFCDPSVAGSLCGRNANGRPFLGLAPPPLY